MGTNDNPPEQDIKYESKDIGTKEAPKYFVRTKKKADPGKAAKTFLSELGSFIKAHKGTLILGVFIVIFLLIATYVVLKIVLPRDIVIGDIVITEKQIRDYTEELRLYKEQNPSLIIDNPREMATDNLITNAALRYYGKTYCPDIEVDLSGVEAEYSQSEYYRRVPAENSAYKNALNGCLIATQSYLHIGIVYSTPAFLENLGPEDRAQAFTNAKARLNDEFLPLFKQELSKEEIAAHANRNLLRVYDPDDPFDEDEDENDDPLLRVWADYGTCTGGQEYCFNDKEDIKYEVSPGELQSLTGALRSLKNIGDYTEVIASQAGTFSILRLEGKTDAPFNSWDQMLSDTKKEYIHDDIITKIFSSLILWMFPVKDVYAAETIINGWIKYSDNTYKCSQHLVKFYIRAQTEGGIGLGGFGAYINQPGATAGTAPSNTGSWCAYGYDGIVYADATDALINLQSNCNQQPPNLAGPGSVDGSTPIKFGADITISSNIIKKHPTGWEETTFYSFTIYRFGNDIASMPDPAHPAASFEYRKNRTVPWRQDWMNIQGSDQFEFNSVGYIMVYKDKDITTDFKSTSNLNITGVGDIWSGWDNDKKADAQIGLSYNTTTQTWTATGDNAPSITPTTAGVSINNVTFQQQLAFSTEKGYDKDTFSDTDDKKINYPVTTVYKYGSGDTNASSYATSDNITTSSDTRVAFVPSSTNSEIPPPGGQKQDPIRKWTEVPETSKDPQKDVRHTVYSARGTININFKPASGTSLQVTVCQGIKYVSKEFNITNKSGTKSGGSRVCIDIVITADQSPDIPPPVQGGNDCDSLGFYCKPDYGDTTAWVTVSNLTKSKTETTSKGEDSSKNRVYVWAKPGDSVQYSHNLGFGAQAVTGSTYANPTRSSASGGAGAITQNTFRVDSKTTPATATSSNPTGNYLFGQTLSALSTTPNSTGTVTLAKAQARPTQTSSADIKSDYFFTYYSPSIANSNYSCMNNYLSGFELFRSGGYQIPDFSAPVNCHKPTPVSNNDAGKIIEQSLSWNNVKAWVDERHTDHGGNCGCTCDGYGNGRYSTNPPVTSVADARAAGSSIGHYVYECYLDGSPCGWCNCGTTYADRTPYWYFPVSKSNDAVGSTKAPIKYGEVKVPYNYTTTLNLTPNTDKLFPGEEWAPTVTLNINTRTNDVVNGSTPYATITKGSVYEIVEFTVSPGIDSFDRMAKANDSYPGAKSKPACDYYHNGYVSACTSLKRVETTFNNNGNITTPPLETLLDRQIAVPDAPVGTKFCIAAGIWPSDSHNKPKATSLTESDNDDALKADGTMWNYSDPICVTIVKKPNLQVWGSSVTTDSSITTSTSRKALDYSISENTRADNGDGNGRGYSDIARGGSRSFFGSWAEYEVIAAGDTGKFGSGAGLGYKSNTTLGKPGGEQPATYASDPDLCFYTKMTVANNNCSSSTGGSNIISQPVLANLFARYTLKNPPDSAVLDGPITNLNLEGICRFGMAGAADKYMPATLVNGVYVIATGRSYTCLDNGTKYIKVNGDATINPTSSSAYCMVTGDTYASRTSVVHVTGTLTIATNFVYGDTGGGGDPIDGGCYVPNRANYSTDPNIFITEKPTVNTPASRTTSQSTIKGYYNIAELPQQIFIAGDIRIMPNVTNIDGWLIVGQEGTGSGNIDTCYGHSVGSLSANDCNTLLTINGPIITKSITLNRTHGAGQGNASIDPAERFNLRMDTLLWAYNQAQRYSQAVVTYTRELAPRY